MTLSSNEVTGYQQNVLGLVNNLRRSRGLGKLRLSETLNRCAAYHTKDQIKNIGEISHFGSDNSVLKERLKRLCYDLRRGTENVASGQHSAEHLVRSLMRSEGHRDNILDERVDEMGLYVQEDHKGRKYWTQVFGQKQERSKSSRSYKNSDFEYY